jgi:hypothetical protein
MKISTNLHAGYPGGSWTQSCEEKGWNQDTGLLKAICRQRNGALNWTEMYVPDDYDDIVNCDGELQLNYCW